METNEEVLDHFLLFEHKLDLFNSLTENNIKCWHYIRFWVYINIIETMFGKVNHNNAEYKPESNKESLFDKIDNATRKSPLYVKQRDLLVFNHARRIKYNDIYKCVYTDEWLKNCEYSYYVFEEEYKDKHLNPVTTKNLKYFNVNKYGELLKIEKEKYKKNISEKQIKDILSKFENEFNITFKQENKRKIIDIYKYQLVYRDYYIECYLHLLKKIKPKVLILVVAYNYLHMLMIEVAKSLNIKSIELEHGFISTGHIAYNFYEKLDLPAFPDYIFTFGEYDSNIPRFPFDKKFAIPVGSVENELRSNYYKEKLKNKKKKKKIITYLSDSTLELVKNAYDLASNNACDYEIRLKLHPSEYKIWEKIYPFLINSNVKICDDSKHNIYYYLASSDYVVGISSTTVFEATKYDCQIIILAVGEYYRSQALIENKNAFLVQDVSEIYDIVKKGLKLQKNDNDLFFANNSKNKIYKNINNIIVSKI